MVDQPPDTLERLVSAREAATDVGVSVKTIHHWAAKGYLKPFDIDSSGHKLYRLIDVLRTSRDTRQRAVGARRIA